MKIAFLLTGDELMSGDTLDSNSCYLSHSLKELGFMPYIKQVVGDDLKLIVQAIQNLSKQSDVLIINGGLGPTEDDLTAQALSNAMKVRLVTHQQALESLQYWSEQRKIELTPSNLKQAKLPNSCSIIPNPRGSAVGFYCDIGGCMVICTPGVPSEFKPMVDDHVLTLIQQHGSIKEMTQVTRLRLFGFTESGLQESINAHFPDWPNEVEIGFRVQMPVIEVKLITRSNLTDYQTLNKEWTHRFLEFFSDYVIGRDSCRLAQSLIRELEKANKTIVTVESCTGGLVSSAITREAGSSAVLVGGYVSYSNEFKVSQIGVNTQSINQHGAVSEEVARQMVAGGIEKTGADIAIAITGIAGPSGGSDSKPVGTVWIAWGDVRRTCVRRFSFFGGREQVQNTACAVAMDLVRRWLIGVDTQVDYFT